MSDLKPDHVVTRFEIAANIRRMLNALTPTKEKCPSCEADIFAIEMPYEAFVVKLDGLLEREEDHQCDAGVPPEPELRERITNFYREMDNPRPAHCRSCGAMIAWLTTKNGKLSPYGVNADTHFATCPNANAHRRPR